MQQINKIKEISSQYDVITLDESFLTQMYAVLLNTTSQNIIEKKYSNQILIQCFTSLFLGIGLKQIDCIKPELVGYCFIKNPYTRPETMTQIRESHRNLGLATYMRDYILEFYRDKIHGNIIYSAVHVSNLASAKSVLKSGFQLFDITKDEYLQFAKVLPYYKW